MVEDDSRHEHTLEIAATAGNAAEADLICQRLAQAGIQAVSQRSIGGPEWGPSGSRYVYVETNHLDRAREVLEAPDELSDEELARQAEDAAPSRHEEQGESG